jgi:hypothetical protein
MNVELASFHPSGALYFGVAPRFVEIFCISCLHYLSDCDIFGNTLLHVGGN